MPKHYSGSSSVGTSPEPAKVVINDSGKGTSKPVENNGVKAPDFHAGGKDKFLSNVQQVSSPKR